MWRFWRAAGKPWRLVGPGAPRTGEASGDIPVPIIILTSNADAHPLLSGKPKPDSKLRPNRRGKRSLITASSEGVGRRLRRTVARALHPLHLLRFKAAEHFGAEAHPCQG